MIFVGNVQHGRRERNGHLSATVAVPPITHTHIQKKKKIPAKKPQREKLDAVFFYLQQYDSTTKETKHYLKIEDTHIPIREKRGVCMCA